MEPELSPEKKKALEEAQKLRDKAGEEAKLRGTCFDQSKKEFESGDKAKAKQLSEEGKKHGAQMEQYNKQAADAFFAAHNQGRDDYTIDLHGLYVEEALERLNQRFDKIGRKGTLVIIWGAGNHSEGGVRKIKPAVVEVLNKGGWKFEDDTPNHGCCTVYCYSPETYCCAPEAYCYTNQNESSFQACRSRFFERDAGCKGDKEGVLVLLCYVN